MTKEQKQFTSINFVGRISATSNKVSQDFKQETPTKTIYIVPKDKKEIKKLETFGLPIYTPKEKGSESYTIVKSAKTVKHYKSVKDEQPQKMIMTVEDENGQTIPNFYTEENVILNITKVKAQKGKNDFYRLTAILAPVGTILEVEATNPFGDFEPSEDDLPF
nr:MAG TPA: hypothetical protein [Caudoviricetes sp.]